MTQHHDPQDDQLFSIIVTASFEIPGFHAWPEAPDHRDYLRARHRHLFAIEVSVPVRSSEREVECHDLIAVAQNALAEFLNPEGEAVYEFGTLSCEQIGKLVAVEVANALNCPVDVGVKEDRENGAVVSLG